MKGPFRFDSVDPFFDDKAFFKLIKILCIVVLSLTFTYSVVIIYVGAYENLYAHLALYAHNFLVLYLIRTKRYISARYALAIGWPIVVFYTCLIVGADHNFDLAFFIAAFYTFPMIRNKTHQKLIYALNIMLFIGVRVFYVYSSQVVLEELGGFYFSNSLIVFAFIYYLQVIYERTFDANNKYIIEQNKEISALNKDLEQKVQERTKALEEKNKHLEKLLEDAKGYTYIVSHDLKEPVRSVVSFSQLLNKKIASKDYSSVTQYASLIEKSAKRTYSIVTDVLTFYTLDKKIITYESVNINKLVDSITTDLHTIIDENKAKICVYNLPETIKANTVQMNILFSNLITNAIKFKDKATPAIEIKAEETADKWIFSVSDNGRGIPQKYRNIVFQTFKRLENNLNVSGSGLGLSICKRIVEIHQGDIWIGDKETPGTIIQFSIAKDLA